VNETRWFLDALDDPAITWLLSDSQPEDGPARLFNLLRHSAAEATRACNRLSLRWNIRTYARDRQVMIWVWQRDCDGVEAAHTLKLPADPEALEQRLFQLYDAAEGPLSWRWVRPGEWDQAPADARRCWRDTFAERDGY